MKAKIQMDVSFIRQWSEKKGCLHTGNFDELNLSTALQPIFSLAHKRVVGHEALVRAHDLHNNPVSPAQLFTRPGSAAEMIHLDRLCRYIHICNYQTMEDDINWLFLNVAPETISCGREFGAYFKDLLSCRRFPAHRIVIEVVEHPINDNPRLMETINYYKELGCLIALDDFGAGHSNFNRIWTLRPDIVKLDRSFLVTACATTDIRNLLPGIVTLLHQAGALVLMEGVETREQALMAIESDVDFVQGYFFGRPFTDFTVQNNNFNGFSELMADYKQLSERTKVRFREGVDRYHRLFSETVDRLRDGYPMNEACEAILSAPEVVRSYRIGMDGVQIGHTLVAKHYKTITDRRFKPLEDARSADWFRRHYLQRAILHPEQLQVTRPYLSITGAHMCVTLSMKISCPSGDSVLCCDLQV